MLLLLELASDLFILTSDFSMHVFYFCKNLINLNLNLAVTRIAFVAGDLSTFVDIVRASSP